MLNKVIKYFLENRIITAFLLVGVLFGGLATADGVSEVASVGGYVKEYQVDLDPDAMRSYGVNIMQVMLAVKNSNIDVGPG